jgi:Tfp pilus assembly protein PilO
VTLSDRDRKIAVVIAPILVIVAYWFLLLAPKREEASTAADELAAQEQRRDAAQAAVDAVKGAKQGFRSDYTQIVRLGKAIPAQVDMPSVLVQLDAAAAGTGIRFIKIATGERQAAATTAPPANSGSESGQSGAPVAAGGASAQSAPGAAAESASTAQQTADQRSAAAEQSGVSPGDAQTSTANGGGLPVGGAAGTAGAPATAAAGAPAGLEAVPLELEFVGNFFNLADFFHRLKRFVRVANEKVVVSGRLITVDGVSWSSDPDIFPRLRAEVTATIYLSPRVEGTTAGATPAGPALTPPAGTTTGSAESPPPTTPAPTATATP